MLGLLHAAALPGYLALALRFCSVPAESGLMPIQVTFATLHLDPPKSSVLTICL